MTSDKRLWSDKFRDAGRGIRFAVATGLSYRVHFVVATIVVIAGTLCRVTAIEWCVLTLCIGGVLAAETFNSAIEELARAVTAEHNESIGRSLDIAAGAVLLTSVAAIVVGLIVFAPRLVAELNL